MTFLAAESFLNNIASVQGEDSFEGGHEQTPFPSESSDFQHQPDWILVTTQMRDFEINNLKYNGLLAL